MGVGARDIGSGECHADWASPGVSDAWVCGTFLHRVLEGTVCRGAVAEYLHTSLSKGAFKVGAVGGSAITLHLDKQKVGVIV